MNSLMVYGKNSLLMVNKGLYISSYPSFSQNNFEIQTYYDGAYGYGVYVGDNFNIKLLVKIYYRIKFLDYRVGWYGVFSFLGVINQGDGIQFLIDSNTDNYDSSSAPPCYSLGIGSSMPYIHFSENTFYDVEFVVYSTKLVLRVNDKRIERQVDLLPGYKDVRLFIRTGGSNHQDGYIKLQNGVIYVYNHRYDTDTLLNYEVYEISVVPMVVNVL